MTATAARPWANPANGINFAALLDVDEPDDRVVLPFGTYRLRLEYVQVRGRCIAPRWRVLDGPYRGAAVETAPWRDTDLARYLGMLGIPEEQYSQVQSLAGFASLLEGRCAYVVLLDQVVLHRKVNTVFRIEPS